jgi:hypothetical protein
MGYPVQLPDGTARFITELAEAQKEEARLPSYLLKEGDMLAAQYVRAGKPQGLTFEVQKTEWLGLGNVGGEPDLRLEGRLSGEGMGEEITGRELAFMGSGWGGSSAQPGVIATNLGLYFRVIGEMQEVRTPPLHNFQIFRKDASDEYQELNPNQLENEARHEVPEHELRLQRVEALMHAFGFDKYSFRDKDFNRAQPNPEKKHGERELTYESDRFMAVFTTQATLPNRLAVYDKEKKIWSVFSYANEQDKDTLITTFSDCSDIDMDELLVPDFVKQPSLTSSTTLHTSGVEQVTYSTSSRLGLNVLTYIPSDAQAGQVLHLPVVANNQTRPAISFFAGGEVSIERDWNMSVNRHRNPDIEAEILSAVRLHTEPDGSLTLQMKDTVQPLPDPDRSLESILQAIATSDAEHAETGHTRKQRAAHRAGKLLRKMRRNNAEA